MTTFAIDLAVAEKFGLIEPPQRRQGSVVGPNAVHLPSVTYDNQTTPTDSSNRRDMNWNGEQSSGIQPTDVTREVTDQVF